MGATRCGREHAHGPAPQWPRGLRANPGRLTRRELGALAPFMGVGPIHLRNPTTSSEEVAAARSPLSPSFACCLRTANSASCASDSGLSQTQRAGSDIESQPAADPRTYLTRRTSPTGETMTHGRHSDRVDQAPTAVQPETRCLRTRPILRVAVPAPQSARSALGHGSGGRPLALVDPSPRFARSRWRRCARAPTELSPRRRRDRFGPRRRALRWRDCRRQRPVFMLAQASPRGCLCPQPAA